MIKTYKDLIVWQKGMILCKKVYSLCKSMPKEELFGLTSQIKRSVISIPSNIAEGHQRAHTKEYKNFISIALGSIAELETQLLLGIDLEFLNKNDTNEIISLLIEIQKMLKTIHRKL